LAQATARELDELWLRAMIEHHQGAVEMAEAQLRNGSYFLATASAQDIIDRQGKEIDEMTTLLGQ
ncbi:DUF305 domain-containing protein, partial [Saccharomonospora sp. NPDC046836]|uniref:DUF305 domain-containing protein n=1 Tax=Saccharomonospora sp. NPDC046836 TaxID=3156921 RepID=UPI0033C2F898